MGFSDGRKWIVGLVIAMGLVGGCASPLPALPGQETTSGGSDSSDAVSAVTLDTIGGETADADIDTSEGETEDTGLEPSCGNGIVEVGESCDTTALGGETCEGLGFGVGPLSCDDECRYEVTHCTPSTPVLDLSFSQIKRFDFNWTTAEGAEYYQVLESPALGEPYGQLGDKITGESASFEMPLHFRLGASYVLRACNTAGCTDAAAVDVAGSLAEAVGYVKASNTDAGDYFGWSVALSGDGNTLVVGAHLEDSNVTGIEGNQGDNTAVYSGAVYVFVRNGAGAWSQQAYIKASNTGGFDYFGGSVALSGDGNTLAVGATGESSSATGIGGNQADNTASFSGAVYVFVRDEAGSWSQQAYVKASNTGAGDYFGRSVALSGDGNTLAAGAYHEDSNATDIGGGQADNSLGDSGAVYVFVRDGAGSWSQQAYVKASNTDAGDEFGDSVSLSGDGNTLAVGAAGESSNATGIGGDQANNSTVDSGAVYVLVRNGAATWSQQAYIKASNAGAGDEFGGSVSLSGDGNILAVGAYWEDSSAMGIGGDQTDNSASTSGAVYVFIRNGAGTWSQQAYIKASNTDAGDRFGNSVGLSGDGNTLAVGAREDSNATGLEGDQADNSASSSGAVYVFVSNRAGAWSQKSYVKASNTGASDDFGGRIALSGDGNTLVVGAHAEDSNASGIRGNQADNNAEDSGAVYLY